MKKAVFTFLLAVLAPSLVLGWLALRSLQNQQLVAERQRAQLFQGTVEAIAARMNEQLIDHRHQFAREVEELLARAPAADVTSSFHSLLTTAWPLAEVGFVVSLDGGVMAPSVFEGQRAREFRVANDVFLCSTETVEVYYNTPKGPISLSKLDRKEQAAANAAETAYAPPPDKTSKWNVTKTRFQQLVHDQQEGTFARFLQDELYVMFWYRSPRMLECVFGSQLHLPRLVKDIEPLITVPPEHAGEMAVALLDERGRRLVAAPAEFDIGAREPFASVEVSESLPHWELVAYYSNPTGVVATARATQRTVLFLTILLLLAIAVGGGAVVMDVRRQLALARQKTNFVSNVSHELKTPLTSIRMFSELLAEREDLPAGKRRSYVDIIGSETARLTRLINNVLDFARMDRGETKYEFRTADVSEIVRSAVASCRPALEEAGFAVEMVSKPETIPARVDRDAIAQVLLNLLSNAEKYSNHRKAILVEVRRNDDQAEVRVMDRGIGVPPGCREKIFEQFFRADDSLASGVQGSGLGLTLARKIARAHGGDLRCEPRDGGGTTFILTLPTDQDGDEFSGE